MSLPLLVLCSELAANLTAGEAGTWKEDVNFQ